MLKVVTHASCLLKDLKENKEEGNFFSNNFDVWPGFSVMSMRGNAKYLLILLSTQTTVLIMANA
ncbi:Alpha-L-fucosidase 2 [Bienertia sinuspersici]